MGKLGHAVLWRASKGYSSFPDRSTFDLRDDLPFWMYLFYISRSKKSRLVLATILLVFASILFFGSLAPNSCSDEHLTGSKPEEKVN